MKVRELGRKLGYPAAVAAALGCGLLSAWTPLASQVDNDAYDWFFRLYDPPAWQTESVILAIDEASLLESGGVQGLRGALADGLNLLLAARPRAVVVDMILADTGSKEADAKLEAACRGTANLVLAADLLPGGAGWEDPLPRFRRWAAAVGHVHAYPDPLDSVTRSIPLERATQTDRRWALSLEAWRVGRMTKIVESPDEVTAGDAVIPAARADGRLMRVRFVPPSMPAVPRIPLRDLRAQPALAAKFSGKTVFVGVTAQTAVRDRLMTPYSFSVSMPGVEIHANAFETIAQGLFLTDAPDSLVLLLCVLLCASAGAAYRFLTGWRVSLASVALVLSAHAIPYLAFREQMVFPFTPPAAVAWLSIVTAAAYVNLVVRRRLMASESERARYQEAMHFVTHEMRTPLTAIQGSSELMTRYNMSEAKRKEIASLINSESKRLGRMIEVFLSMERLTAGQVEMRKDHFPPAELIQSCIERARPLADRKQIEIAVDEVPGEELSGDRELMEYAFYNLLTNAVKYSPPGTRVTVAGGGGGGEVRLSVKDQGIGMDASEVARVFDKFYRTRRAEESGEKGTGIGLSIVRQIVVQHGGRIEVSSSPGLGSCFTVILPLASTVSS